MAKILYLVAEDWFFCTHVIERAAAAHAAGHEVAVMTRLDRHGEVIAAHGLRVIPWGFDRRSVNPLRELRSVAQVARVYREQRPDLVHHFALKPVLYGSLAARCAKVRAVVNAPVGMGYVFSSDDLRARLLRLPMRLALRLLVNPRGSRVVFENPDDRDAMIAAGWVRAADAALIRGAGVDLATFDAAPEPEGVPIVALTARMLRDKGIGEFVEAARILRREGVPARFILAGAPDPGNRAAIPEETLRAWAAEGAVEYLGFQADVPALLRQSAIVCLPSYREGLPKALLEALAAARPIVTTDVPGCRETVIPGVNGLLVPTRDPSALAAALGALLRDPARRKTMGAAGRRLAETEFSNARVVAETLRVYRDLGAE